MDLLAKPEGLSVEQRLSLSQKGYVVLKHVFDRERTEELAAAIWQQLGMRPDRPSDWYDLTLRNQSGIDSRGMVPWYHSQLLWDARTDPLLHAAFADIWNCEALAVSIDRVNFNVPVTEAWSYEGFIHWDIDVGIRPIARSYQGILALSDAAEDAGGFQCAAGFHTSIEAWLDRQPPGYRTRFPATSGMCIEQVELEAGDFLIFDGSLPHGNTPNRASCPRLAFYITMMPWESLDDALRAERQVSLSLNTAPRAFSGALMPDPRGIREEIVLTKLGEKLWGSRRW